MNQTEKISNDQECIHLSFQHEEYRLTIQSTIKEELSLVARYTVEDVLLIQHSKAKMVVIEHDPVALVDAISIATSTFFLEERSICFDVKRVRFMYQFDEYEWHTLMGFKW